MGSKKPPKKPISFNCKEPSEFDNSSYVINVDQIIYGSFVTMLRMADVTRETFSGTSIAAATEINIFIDLFSVLHQIFSKGYRTNITNNTIISSTLINMCAHYRRFFRQLGVKTNFYLIFSTNCHDINKKLVYGYNYIFEQKSQIKLFKKITDVNFKILSVLCPYLPDIHFIKSEENYEVGVIIAALIEKINDGNPNLIISKDLYPLQLCTKYPYTSYLFPIKRFNTSTRTTIDQSIMVPLTEKQTHNIAFWNLVAERRKLNPNTLYGIDTRNFTLLESLHHFAERGIKPLAGNITACTKIIRNLGGEDIEIMLSQLYEDTNLVNTVPINLIESRYKALDVSFVLPYYKLSPEFQSIKLQNLDDNGTINMINSKYFTDNPINIMDL
jgi:hypothetical protein